MFFFYIVAFLVCQEYPIIYANERLACYIMNTHLRNRFQTATATAANTPGLRSNRISAQTVHNRLNWTRVHTRWNTEFFLPRMNQDFLYNVVMARCACTVGEMNAILTVVFLNEIVSGVGVLSWSGQPLPMVFVHH